ncbi:DUF2807 domain-containing protein [Sphingomonas sp. H39-1-10]|uniref:head GIN domain-containing protein n=1 Tax=Sphingomonas TaxID=13687 RepID=UPI000888CAAB|nr:MULTISPECIES: head GIN domain-containing protein [Sphingomonas]MDF0488113.1 DUF2807 domain-containing protein [Sphingomonas pollutisoli]SDA33533.1 Putative auto-transporter adhesin, head GIN domain [Sphingomonas sp. NFR15]
MRFASLIALMALVACSPAEDRDAAAATGGGTSRIYEVAGFNGVALRGSDDVDIRVGSGFSVRAEGPAAELDALRIVRDGDVLSIGRKQAFGFQWGDKAHVKIFVTMPRITSADLTGTGDLAIDRVEGERFRLHSQGSGDVAIGTLGVESADLTLSGTGGLSAKGSAHQLKIDLTGSGDVDAAGLKATNATVSVLGTGSVRATVEGPARVSVTGTGDVDLGPAARCSTTNTGTGEVRCGG